MSTTNVTTYPQPNFLPPQDDRAPKPNSIPLGAPIQHSSSTPLPIKSDAMLQPQTTSLSPTNATIPSSASASSSSLSTADTKAKRRPSDVSLTTVSSANEGEGVSPKRQVEFEKYFAERIGSSSGGKGTGDNLRVISTKAADLQRKVLVHGRLYLTHTHLCFRSNILGIVTEYIYALKDLISVEKGTTAKWIQNAVYLTMDCAGEEKQYNYGSILDRDGFHDSLVECWKEEAPERFNKQMVNDAIQPKGGDEDAIQADEGVMAAEGEIKHTSCSGEHYAELAIDTKFPITPAQVFDLVYHNGSFRMGFLQKDEGLTDVKITDWGAEEGGKKRSLTYVMHMNNSIGPSKSDCVGSEQIVAEDPEKAYEIVSETQTPDVPSGTKFKIHTRTCLTHTDLNGKRATRMYCTTQTDWSSSSMLKSMITPAVIDGQKSYHQRLTAKIREWIKSHPEEFGTITDTSHQDLDDVAGSDVRPASTSAVDGGRVEVETGTSKDLLHHAKQIWGVPMTMGIVGFGVLLVAINVYQLFYSASRKIKVESA